MFNLDPQTIATIVLLAVCLVVGVPTALVLEKRRAAANPEARTYAWGYYGGVCGLIAGSVGLLIIAAGLLAASDESANTIGTGVLLVAAYGVPGYFVIKRKRWAWIVHTLCTLNPILWLIDGIYGKNRWHEMGQEARARKSSVSDEVEADVKGEGPLTVPVLHRGRGIRAWHPGQLATVWVGFLFFEWVLYEMASNMEQPINAMAGMVFIALPFVMLSITWKWFSGRRRALGVNPQM